MSDGRLRERSTSGIAFLAKRGALFSALQSARLARHEQPAAACFDVTIGDDRKNAKGKIVVDCIAGSQTIAGALPSTRRSDVSFAADSPCSERKCIHAAMGLMNSRPLDQRVCSDWFRVPVMLAGIAASESVRPFLFGTRQQA